MMTCSYFDSSVAQNFEKYQRAKTPESNFKRMPKISKELMNVSGAKNLKLLRDQGKIKMVHEKPEISRKNLKYSSQSFRVKTSETSRPIDGVFKDKYTKMIHDSKDMIEVEKIIINDEDKKNMQREKEEFETTNICSYYREKQARNRYNRLQID